MLVAGLVGLMVIWTVLVVWSEFSTKYDGHYTRPWEKHATKRDWKDEERQAHRRF